MSYQVYFTDFTEENNSLIIAILRLKEEAGKLEPEEIEMLTSVRGNLPPMPEPQQLRRASAWGRRRPHSGSSERNGHSERNGDF
ncbi:MAG: hypothetical protein O2812_00590 [Chloroflexi bacterium]|nr:hypothetical protein [Chloroflexota bacterium]